MIGAYVAYQISAWLEALLPGTGFWLALVVAPLVVGAARRRDRALWPARACTSAVTCPNCCSPSGCRTSSSKLVQIIWGRAAVPYPIPPALAGSLFIVYSTHFPAYRGFMMLVAALMLLATWLMLTRTRIGLVIQAALTHPETVEALGHNVPRVFMLVFGGGTALAGLAGVIGGNAFVTEPSMAALVGVDHLRGGGGGRHGFACRRVHRVAADRPDADLRDRASTGRPAALLASLGVQVTAATPLHSVLTLKLSQIAPVLPYLLMVLVLIFRPRGLMGTREG